jgi:hypothetical protein
MTMFCVCVCVRAYCNISTQIKTTNSVTKPKTYVILMWYYPTQDFSDVHTEGKAPPLPLFCCYQTHVALQVKN